MNLVLLFMLWKWSDQMQKFRGIEASEIQEFVYDTK